ncbi:MAG TPA: SPFH domain-containing protein, partial [Clostridia bacterium]|nr:SPFH domain-containing protein [Clostridia bacterium]
WKLPIPAETVEVHDVSRVQNLFVGYEPADTHDYLWTSAHGGTEYTLLSGNGNELVAVNIRLKYHVGDLMAYRTRYNDPEALLSSRAYTVLMERTMSSNLDTVLSVNRETLANEILSDLNRYSREMQIGIVVGEVIIESIHPPMEVATVYQNVVNAAIQKSTLLSQAQAYADETANKAKERKATDVSAALAAQISRVAQARSAARTFSASCEAYLQSPDSYALRRLTAAYENIIKGSKLYVFSPKMEKEMERFLLQNGQAVTVVE